MQADSIFRRQDISLIQASSTASLSKLKFIVAGGFEPVSSYLPDVAAGPSHSQHFMQLAYSDEPLVWPVASQRFMPAAQDDHPPEQRLLMDHCPQWGHSDASQIRQVMPSNNLAEFPSGGSSTDSSQQNGKNHLVPHTVRFLAGIARCTTCFE